MDRRAMGEAAGCADEGRRLNGVDKRARRLADAPIRGLGNCLPGKAFPGYPSPL